MQQLPFKNSVAVAEDDVKEHSHVIRALRHTARMHDFSLSLSLSRKIWKFGDAEKKGNFGGINGTIGRTGSRVGLWGGEE